MKIPGWAYIGIGIVMTGLSGYLYKFVPKPDGTPNTAMALFFFIGIIFILVGFIKTFFKRLDDKSESEYEQAKEQLEKNKHANLKDYKQNRIETEMNKAYSTQNASDHSKTNQTAMHGHASQYAKTHPYHGIKHETLQNQQAQQSAKQSQTMNIAPCKRCGVKNSAAAHYCHSCGNRLI